MLFHVSMSANDPRHVATVLAELCGGIAVPFPPVAVGSWITITGDDRGTALEVYPIDTVLRGADGDADATSDVFHGSEYTATHAAIGTQLGVEQVLAIADREGWSAKLRNRGGMFGVIELWIEGRQMIELLTPQMQHEYRAGMTIENWQRMLNNLSRAAATV